MFDFPDILSNGAEALFIPFADAALKGLLIMLVAFAICYLLRRSSASLRHLCWTLALGAVIIVPLLSGVIPQIDVQMWPNWMQGGASTAGLAPTAMQSKTVTAPEPAAHATSDMRSTTATTSGPLGRAISDMQSRTATAPAPLARAESALQSQSAVATAAEAGVSGRAERSWVTWLVLAWAAVAGVILLHMLVGFIAVILLIRRSRPVEHPQWEGVVSAIRSQLQVRRDVRLVKTSRISVPMTWGFMRPVVLLPQEADAWSEEKRRCVLAHELMHVKRYDCLTQSIATAACALHWFNPLVWKAAHNMRLEREKACDDSVLVSSRTKASAYATHLLDIARGVSLRRAPAVAVTMAHASQLEGRVLAILDEERPRRSRPYASVLSAVVAAAVVLATAAMHPVAVPQHAGPGVATAADGVADEAPLAAMARSRAMREPSVSSARSTSNAARVEARQGGTVMDVIKRSFSVTPGGSLTVETDMGNIEVRTSDGNTVEVEVYRRPRGAASETDFDVAFRQVGNEIEITGERRIESRGSNGINVDFRITVPRRFNLDLHTAGGNVKIADLDGMVDVHTSGGNLAFGRIKGSIDAHTSGGNVTVDGSDGDVDIHTSGGNISLGRVGGSVDVETSGGNISIDEVYGDLDAQTSGGEINARIARQPNGDSELRTSGGSITVYLADGVAVNLDAETSAGYVVSDVEVTTRGEARKDRVRGTINGGGPELVLDTSAGDIRIKRL